MTIEIDPRSQTSASLLRRVLLNLMLALIGIGVAVALIAVIRGQPLGETLSKILNTAMGAGLFAALALACTDAAERKPTLLSYAGIAAACVAVVILFVGIWFDQARLAWWWKAFAIAALYSVALWRCSRFTLVELAGVGAIVVRATIASCIGIATVVALMILRDKAEPGLVRAMNAMWILAIGGHVAIPILVRLQKRP